MSVFSGSRYEGVGFTAIVDRDTGRVRKLLNLRDQLTEEDLEGRFATRTLQQNQLLDEIAFDLYGKERLWFVIAEINEIDYPFDMETGQILTVPFPEVIRRFR